LIALEALGLLRNGCDTYFDYRNSSELKKLRFACVTHIVDWLVQERSHVHENDEIKKKEALKDKVTLDNVFEIAK